MSSFVERDLRTALVDVDDVATPDPTDVLARASAVVVHHRRRRVVAGALAAALIGGGLVVGVKALRGPDRPSIEVGTPTPTTAAAVLAVEQTLDSATWWDAVPADPRGPTLRSLTVWTGREVLSVGGRDGDNVVRRAAAAYDPDAATWRLLSAPPSDVVESELVLAVGVGDTAALFIGHREGRSFAYRYDPASDQWTVAALPPVLVDASSPSVWTGTRLLVWSSSAASQGAIVAYDPTTDRWDNDIASPPLGWRPDAGSVWTGSTWVVWGGGAGGAEYADGAVFDPVAGSWRLLPAAPLRGRWAPMVWTGTEVLILAGATGGEGARGGAYLALSDGAAYNPATDSWRRIADGSTHPGYRPVWTGRYALLFAKGNVAMYDPSHDVWIPSWGNDTGTGNGSDPVWTGSVAVVLGDIGTDTGGATFRPPAYDGPPVSEAVWTATYKDATGIDYRTAFRLNEVLGFRTGAYHDGITDVVMIGNGRLRIAGNPATIEALRPDIEALGLTIADVRPTDGHPAVTVPATASRSG